MYQRTDRPLQFSKSIPRTALDERIKAWYFIKFQCGKQSLIMQSSNLRNDYIKKNEEEKMP